MSKNLSPTEAFILIVFCIIIIGGLVYLQDRADRKVLGKMATVNALAISGQVQKVIHKKHVTLYVLRLENGNLITLPEQEITIYGVEL